VGLSTTENFDGDYIMDIIDINRSKHILLDQGFRGCIQISNNKQPVFTQAYGYADFPNQIPNTLETKFATASAGKVFVAVSILQLVENGKLCLQDTLGNILPLDWRKIDTNITVEQLLMHTSGIPDYFDESVMSEYEDLWKDFPNYRIRTNADLLPLFLHKPMMYPRGTKFQYNNTGFVVLAMMIEAVTNQPFDIYLQSNVFNPCGMDSTGYYEMDSLPAKCANSYIFERARNRFRTNIYSVDAKGTGAGGAFTTVGDIQKFWDALLSYKLIAQKTTFEMLRCHNGNEEAGYYGYGIWLEPTDNGYSPYFQGCDPGVSFISYYEPSVNVTITLVSNYGDNVWKLLRSIRECIMGK
jgi:CubicO group peptidase (beta-lactamase class C family)